MNTFGGGSFGGDTYGNSSDMARRILNGRPPRNRQKDLEAQSVRFRPSGPGGLRERGNGSFRFLAPASPDALVDGIRGATLGRR